MPDYYMQSQISPLDVNGDASSSVQKLQDSYFAGKYKEMSGITDIKEFSSGPQEGGYYDPKYPTTINVNPHSQWAYGATVAHERQHMLDNFRNTQNYNPKGKDYSGSVKDIYGKYRGKYKLADDFLEHPFEELRGIESQLPPGKGILDTDIGKEMFHGRDDLLMQYFYNTRPMDTTYMTEPHDNSWMSRIKGMFNGN